MSEGLRDGDLAGPPFRGLRAAPRPPLPSLPAVRDRLLRSRPSAISSSAARRASGSTRRCCRCSAATGVPPWKTRLRLRAFFAPGRAPADLPLARRSPRALRIPRLRSPGRPMASATRTEQRESTMLDQSSHPREPEAPDRGEPEPRGPHAREHRRRHAAVRGGPRPRLGGRPRAGGRAREGVRDQHPEPRGGQDRRSPRSPASRSSSPAPSPDRTVAPVAGWTVAADGRDRRVVVTGLGAVTAAGWGVAPLARGPAIGPHRHRALRPLRPRSAAHPRRRDRSAGPPAHATGRCVRWSRLSNSDRFALFSACEAAEQAGLSVPFDAGLAGVFFGSSTGGLLRDRASTSKHLVRQPGAPSPAGADGLASRSSAPAETVARHLGVRGPVETISSACASGGLAIEQALRALCALARSTSRFAGGADCLCLTTYSGFNALRAVDERPCRPFRGRSGRDVAGRGRSRPGPRVARARARPGRAPARRDPGRGLVLRRQPHDGPPRGGPGGGGGPRARPRRRRPRGRRPSTSSTPTERALRSTTPRSGPLCRASSASAREASRWKRRRASWDTCWEPRGRSRRWRRCWGSWIGEVHPTPGGGDIDPALPVDLVLDGPRPVPGHAPRGVGEPGLRGRQRGGRPRALAGMRRRMARARGGDRPRAWSRVR